MASFRRDGNRGILDPATGHSRFRLTRVAPAPQLSLFVDRYWVVEWDLRGRPPFTQEVLPHPSVHVAVEDSVADVHGVSTERSVHRLEGRGRVVGAKFRPGGFAPLFPGPVSDLSGRELPIAELFGGAGTKLVDDVRACADHEDAIAVFDGFLRERLPLHDVAVAEVARIAESMLELDPGTRLEDLASMHAMSVRTLQRRFRDYVGVGPKWLLQRYRLHDAAERMADGRAGDLASLALDLGYFDQAHFINDFRDAIGMTPVEYSAVCDAARQRVAQAMAA